MCPGRRVSYRLSQLGSPVHLPSGPRVGQGSVRRAVCCCPWPPSHSVLSAPKMLLESQTAGWERSRHQFPGTWDSPFRNTSHGPGLGPQVLPVPPLPPGPGAKEVGSACSPGGPLPTSLARPQPCLQGASCLLTAEQGLPWVSAHQRARPGGPGRERGELVPWDLRPRPLQGSLHARPLLLPHDCSPLAALVAGLALSRWACLTGPGEPGSAGLVWEMPRLGLFTLPELRSPPAMWKVLASQRDLSSPFEAGSGRHRPGTHQRAPHLQRPPAALQGA